MSDDGQGFEARARRASASVRDQLAAVQPPAAPGRRPARRPIGTVPRLAAAAALVVGIAVVGPQVVGGPGNQAHAAGALKAFADCDDALAYFTEHAADYLIERASPRWGSGMASVGGREAIPMAAAGAAEDTAGADAAARAPEHSDTNVAEAGVDEPDLVKTDGRIIVAVARGRVHLVGADHGRLTRLATLPDTGVGNVFLAGTRVLVFSGQRPATVPPDTRSTMPRQFITVYDIASVRSPKPVATLAVEGEVLDARLVGDQVRVATTFSPDLDIPSPSYGDNGEITAASKRALRAAVASSSVDDWLPAYTLTDGSGAEVSSGRLVACPDLAAPDTFSGIDTVAVSSFDLADDLADRRTVGVVAGGQQIYATDTATYVATTDWDRDQSAATTSLHKFVTAASGATAYRGSGAVPGTLLNQYAMSDVDGVLRVATTVSGQRGWTNPRTVNEGVVTTLAERGGALQQLGQLGGLGREDNESIQAVRFIGSVGYVVTYRRTDPLYALDLSDPAAPKITGELKIPGYSGYLHPIGEDRLLGVGQNGSGKVQFSLFDVGDPARPQRLDTQTYGWGNAAAEFDPKAFLAWAPRELVLAPVTSYGRDKAGFSGLVLLRTAGDRLREDGRIDPPRSAGPVVRSLVIGDDVYVLSERGLQANRLDGYRLVDRLKF